MLSSFDLVGHRSVVFQAADQPGVVFSALPRTDRDRHKEFKRSRRRAKVLQRHIPKGGVGAEIGVFWGHFSEHLLRDFAPKKLYLVDPWDQLFGDIYPDWGEYTERGGLTPAETKEFVHELAQNSDGVAQVYEGYSVDFLAALPDGCLDWVYLDAAHAYKKVQADLQAILPKLTEDGIIFGDDYYLNEKSQHHGVLRAVNEFAHETRRKLVLEDCYQYLLLPRHATRR